ncbi:MAG: hypothetical protein JXA81_00265 [Sedimentisphaerales bacterium]|nr:hypothetical protein [Sedimentisphaerales bacterium]
MTRRNKTIFMYCILILLAAALIEFNRFINPKKASPPEKDYAAKLAEFRADLIRAAKADNKQQPASSNTARTSTGRSPKARPT